ncbi:MAG: hypothetical protein ACRDVE_20590 [Actinocrinis sp.]
MTDTEPEPISQTTDKPDDACEPFHFDFEKLVAEVDTGIVERALSHKVRDLVEHFGRHLREENPDLTDREIARVLVSASALVAVLAMRSRTWTANGVLNLISATGAHLWHQADQPPAEPADEQHATERTRESDGGQ